MSTYISTSMPPQLFAALRYYMCYRGKDIRISSMAIKEYKCSTMKQEILSKLLRSITFLTEGNGCINVRCTQGHINVTTDHIEGLRAIHQNTPLLSMCEGESIHLTFKATEVEQEGDPFYKECHVAIKNNSIKVESYTEKTPKDLMSVAIDSCIEELQRFKKVNKI